MIRGLGCLPDPIDDRDQGLGLAIGADLAASPPPARASVAHPEVGPKDQGRTSSCTGQAAALGIRLAYLAAGLACPDLSALDAYFKSRADWGGQRQDGGSNLRSTIKSVQHAGIAAEADWPFVAERVNRRPSWAAARSAFDRRGVRGYYRCYSADDVRRALAAGFPVIGGFDVDEAFMEHDGNGAVDQARGRIIGGHALTIEDCEPDGTFGLLNSWGEIVWGRRGRARATEGFVETGRDKWAVVVS